MTSPLRTKSRMDTSESAEAANELTKRTLWRNMDRINTSKSQSASIPSPPELGLGRIITPGENEGYMSSWFWTDDEYIFLNSTPFTFNVPFFRHSPIRPSKAGLDNADDIDVLDWKLLSSPDETLDWTAFHVAILGGAGDFFSDPSDFCAGDDEEELMDGLCDWLSGLGYSSHSLGALGTASSVPGGTQELISKFVDILVRDASVARMVSMALSEDGMGQERFRRNFGRILRSYSRELRHSLEKGKPGDYDASYGHAAAFVSRKAPHASHLIVSRFSQARKSMPLRDGLADSNDASSSGSEGSEAIPCFGGH